MTDPRNARHELGAALAELERAHERLRRVAHDPAAPGPARDGALFVAVEVRESARRVRNMLRAMGEVAA